MWEPGKEKKNVDNFGRRGKKEKTESNWIAPKYIRLQEARAAGKGRQKFWHYQIGCVDIWVLCNKLVLLNGTISQQFLLSFLIADNYLHIIMEEYNYSGIITTFLKQNQGTRGAHNDYPYCRLEEFPFQASYEMVP